MNQVLDKFNKWISFIEIKRDSYIKYFDYLIRFAIVFHYLYVHNTFGAGFRYVFYEGDSPFHIFQNDFLFGLYFFVFYSLIVISFLFDRIKYFFFIPIYLMYIYLIYLDQGLMWGWALLMCYILLARSLVTLQYIEKFKKYDWQDISFNIIFIILSLFYVKSALNRVDSPVWANGMALKVIYDYPLYSRFLFLGEVLPNFVFRISSYFAVMAEYSSVFILFLRPKNQTLKSIRKILVFALLAMHIGIHLTIFLEWWSIIAMGCLCYCLTDTENIFKYTKLKVLVFTYFLSISLPYHIVPKEFSKDYEIISYKLTSPFFPIIIGLFGLKRTTFPKRACLYVIGENKEGSKIIHKSDRTLCTGEKVHLKQDFYDIYSLRNLDFTRIRLYSVNKRVYFYCNMHPNYDVIHLLHDRGINNKNNYGIVIQETIDCTKMTLTKRSPENRKVFESFVESAYKN